MAVHVKQPRLINYPPHMTDISLCIALPIEAYNDKKEVAFSGKEVSAAAEKPGKIGVYPT